MPSIVKRFRLGFYPKPNLHRPSFSSFVSTIGCSFDSSILRDDLLNISIAVEFVETNATEKYQTTSRTLGERLERSKKRDWKARVLVLVPWKRKYSRWGVVWRASQPLAGARFSSEAPNLHKLRKKDRAQRFVFFEIWERSFEIRATVSRCRL